MATYTREGKFTPVNIDSNQIPALQQKMALMAKGEALIRSQYQNALDLDLTHGENQAKLNTFFKDAQEKVNKVISKGNLDNYANVDAALQIFDPLASEEYRSVMMDNSYTKHYKEQIAVAERYRNQKEKDGSVGSGYSDFNYKDLVNHYSQFKTGDPNDYNSWGSKYSYRPYYDDAAERRELAKEFLKLPDSFTRESVNEYGVVTSTTYGGKSASQLQKYISNNLSAKAKDQALLEGRVLVYDMKDNEYLKFLTEHTEKQLKEVDDDLVRLQVLKKDKNNKSFTEAEFKKQFDYLSDTRKELAENLQKLSDPDYQKSEIKKKAETFANYYLNKKIANTASAMANDRVSIKLETNSAIVSALNRQQNLNMFLMKFYEDKRQFDDMLEHRKNVLEANLKGNNGGGLLNEGTPTDPKTGLPAELQNEPIKDEKELTALVEAMESEVEGGLKEVLSKTLKYANDAFGINYQINPKNSKENPAMGLDPKSTHSQIAAVAEIANLSQRLQNGDKELMALLHSSEADEKSFSKKQLATKKILTELENYNMQRLVYSSYVRNKKITSIKAEKTLLATFKSLPADKQQHLMNGMYFRGYGTNSKVSDAPLKIDQKYSTIEEVVKAMVENPTLANAYNDLTLSIKGESVLAKDYIQGLLTTGKNKALVQAFYANRKNIYVAKPLDTETPESKAQTTAFNKEVASFTPYLQQLDLYDSDYSPENVVGYTRKQGGVEILYRPAVLENKLIKINNITPKPLFVPVPELGIEYKDQRDKSFLAVLALDPKGETGDIHVKGSVPITYRIGTKTGTSYSADNQVGGFRGSVKIDGKYYDIPYDKFYKPTDVEAFVEEIGKKTEAALIQSLTYDMAKENKAPLTQEQKIELVRSGKFREKYNKKLKEIISDDFIKYSTFGLNNPNYTSSELMFLNQ